MNRIQGFTLVEVTLIAGIISLLLAISSLNLSNIVPNKNLDSTVQSLISDIKFQRTKAMTGEVSAAGIAQDYGIHFNGALYTLFVGSSFSSSASSNFSVNLDHVTVSTTFPNSSLVFLRNGGEIKDFNPSANSITVAVPDSNLSKVIILDKYGAVKSVN